MGRQVEKAFKWIPQAIRKPTRVPKVDVRVQLSETPYFAGRTEIQSIVFSLTSPSGVAKVEEGRVRFYDPDDRAQCQERLGYELKTLYAGRRGAVTEMNRHTNVNVQIVSHHFGHSPEVEAANYLRAVPEDTKRAALALDSALRDNERQSPALTQ